MGQFLDHPLAIDFLFASMVQEMKSHQSRDQIAVSYHFLTADIDGR
jgi:hypothetical protein